MESVIDGRETLIRMSQYLFSDESRELHVNIQNSLVELTLFYEYPNATQVDKLTKLINLRYGITNISINLLGDIIDRLVINESVELYMENIRITEKRYNEILPEINNKKKLFESFNSKLLETISKYEKLKDKKDLVINILYSYLVTLFTREAEIIKNLILKKPEKIMNYDSSKEIINTIFKKYNIKKNKIKNEIIICLTDFFDENGDIDEVLSIIATNFINFEMLNIDPEFHLIEKTSLKNKHIILDTNVVMSLILNGINRSTPTKKIIKKVIDYGVNVYYINKTEEEYIRVLENSNLYYKSISSKKPSILNRLNDPFIKSFIIESRQQGLRWSGFYLTQKALDLNLLKYGVNKYEDKEIIQNIIEDKEFFEKITDHVQKESIKAANIKTKTVAEHDAYGLLLVKSIRKGEFDLLGPHWWFLTFDRTLLNVDQRINEEIGSSDYPSSMVFKLFIESILPFAMLETSSSDLQSAFSELIQTEFKYLPTEIEPKILVEVVDPWLDYDSLSDDEIQTLLCNQQVLNYWNKVKSAKGEHEEIEARKKLGKLIETKVSKLLDERLSETEKKLEEAFNTIKHRSTELDKKSKKLRAKEQELLKADEELKSEKEFNLITKISCLIGGFLLMLFGVIVMVLLNNLEAGKIIMGIGLLLIIISLNWKKFKLSKEGVEVER